MTSFRILDADFKKQEYGDEPYLSNWPMLYMLENGKQAYIGQSNHVKTRMGEHLSNEQKRIFDKVHFIYSSEFNQSVTLDFESKLILYIAADDLLEVTNSNNGIADKNYYGKKEYDQEFYKLWEKLRRKKLVKHTIEELEGSDLFKYSPYKELNDDQREAVESIIASVEQEKEQIIVVNGMPGSGKTIVAIYIRKYLRDLEEFKDKKIGFVVPQTSLRQTLKKVFRSIYNLKADDILGPADVTKEKYDILLVDEAHRLHQYKNIPNRGSFKKACQRIGATTENDELDWILKQSDCSILFYDQDQVVGPSGINVELFNTKMVADQQERRLVSYFKLMSQMRVAGGNEYIDFIQLLLSGKANKKPVIQNYEFKVIDSFAEFNQLLYKKEEENTLCRMAAGYAWKWLSKKDSSKTDIVIEGIPKQWNSKTIGWVHSENAINEVGCIHSVQGYDLNYAFIIVGDEIGYDPKKKEILVRPNHYFDENGKKTATYEELVEYIKHIYYVLMTRGIKGTYLYICDDELKKYICSVVDVY